MYRWTDGWMDKLPCILQHIVPLVCCPALNIHNHEQGKGAADPYCPWMTGYSYFYFFFIKNGQIIKRSVTIGEILFNALILAQSSCLAHLRPKLILYKKGFDGWISIKFSNFAFYSYFYDNIVKYSQIIKKLVTVEKIFFRAFILAQFQPPSSIMSEIIAVWSWCKW